MLSLVLVCIMLLGISINAVAAESKKANDNKSEIVKYMCLVNQQMGVTMTEKDIQELESSIEFAAYMQAKQKRISVDSVYNTYLEEKKRNAFVKRGFS